MTDWMIPPAFIMLGGAVLVEAVFSWPGLGDYGYRSALALDLRAIMGVSLVIAVVFILVNLVVDILYAVIDPRISRDVRTLLKEVGHRSLAQAPLCVQYRVVGTLGLVASPPGFFQEDDLRLLNAIGNQIGAAIANAELRQEALMAERLAAVGRVAASVAHDLRSPLGGILRSAEFLDGLKERIHELLKQPLVIDLRNVYDTQRMKDQGFTYFSVGRAAKDLPHP